MLRTGIKIRAFRRFVELAIFLFLLIGQAESSIAGCIGCESCKSVSKIARCTFYVTEEAIHCSGNKITHGDCGPVCTAAWDGCCACMQNQAACNYAKTLESMSTQDCAKAIAVWAMSHNPK